jgi:hypothetical protein
MKQSLQQFVKKYIKSLNDDNAAIFAGAGSSIPAGFVNWRDLLRDIAEELELKIDQEDDLIALAQYYVNEKGGRGAINQKLVEEFTKGASITTNLELLASLPIRYFWTTNYDNLIETALDKANKTADVKITAENLATSIPKRDAVVYKMHGDKSLPHEAVLTKDDYEDYNSKRQLFTTALQGDLVSKTFLFIGFSFDDPNLTYILSRIRVLLGTNQREHFCFLRQPQKQDYLNKGFDEVEAETQCAYDRLKLNYKIKDLKRYSIQALIIDDYDEVTDVLKQLNQKTIRKNIFISGAVVDYGTWGKERTDDFVFQLSKRIAEKRYRIITGFGLGVSSSIINGALTYLYTTKYQHLDEVIMMMPFPQNVPYGVDIKSVWTDYRKEIITKAGLSIFMFGNKIVNDQITNSDGMLEEFKLALLNNSIPIPIAVTGAVANNVWEEMSSEPNLYGYESEELKSAFYELKDYNKTNDELISVVMKIIGLFQ